MPNWCVGTMKVRGTEKNIKRFLTTALKPVGFMGGSSEPKIELGEGYVELKAEEGMHAFYIEGTRRNFVETTYIEWYAYDGKEDDKQVLLLEDYKAAWGINAHELAELSQEYGLDFKIFAFERGMEFNQDIEVINGEIVKNDEIKYDDYEWECVNPSIGG